jgi:hypothetical protein
MLLASKGNVIYLAESLSTLGKNNIQEGQNEKDYRTIMWQKER